MLLGKKMKNKKTNILFSTLFLLTFFSHLSIVSTSNWKSTGGTNSADEDTQVNFYGTLITHQGQKDAVGHILIEGKHKDIIMYDAPVKHAKEVFNQKTKQTEIKLEENPVTEFSHSKIDLSTISTIKVPNPNTVWIYQKEKKYQKIEFILIQVTPKESTTTKDYLLERKTHISCNTMEKGTQKKEVPLSAIETLTIEGYSFTLSPNKTKENRPAPCPTKVGLATDSTEIRQNV